MISPAAGPAKMRFKVAALYQFVPLADFRELRQPLRTLCNGLGVKGTLLLAAEGINGTVAGEARAVDTLVAELRDGKLFDGRLDNLELKFSTAEAMPFQRMKVRLKKEIVTLGAAVDPVQRVGTYVDPERWNELIADGETLVIDTRNAFEVALGTFERAVDPKLSRFSEFRDYAKRLDPAKHKRIAMFCTGGIRCEKASSYLLANGFDQVFHLKGGILNYLEQMPPEQSRWRGACFVFDERVALGHGLAEQPPATETMAD